MELELLHRDDLPRGGFAGLREHRLVMDRKAFGEAVNPGTWSGIGNFVYLADARFLPKGETGLHSHHEIDVISILVNGRIAHRGSLEHGTELQALDVQVQRAGAEGFTHNEINPDDTENRMLQLWVFPETRGQPAGYKVYKLQWEANLQPIYGGLPNQDETFPSQTVVEVGLLKEGNQVRVGRPFMGYLSEGQGVANECRVKDGDLFRGKTLEFRASKDAQLIIIRN